MVLLEELMGNVVYELLLISILLVVTIFLMIRLKQKMLATLMEIRRILQLSFEMQMELAGQPLPQSQQARAPPQQAYQQPRQPQYEPEPQQPLYPAQQPQQPRQNRQNWGNQPQQ